MKAKTTRLELSGALDDQDDHTRVARGFAYGLAIGVILWLMAAALIVWLI